MQSQNGNFKKKVATRFAYTENYIIFVVHGQDAINYLIALLRKT